MKIEWAQFYAKYTVIAVSALWLLYTGTDYIDRQKAALELRNERLSKNSIGVVEHSLKVEPTYSDELWGSTGNLCTITGKFTLKNTGVLPVAFDSVTFEVYALPPIKEGEIQDGIVSKTISLQLPHLKPMKVEPIEILERVGIGGSLERLFKYTIAKKTDFSYAVVANASGGVATRTGAVDSDYLFGERELEHILVTPICSEMRPVDGA